MLWIGRSSHSRPGPDLRADPNCIHRSILALSLHSHILRWRLLRSAAQPAAVDPRIMVVAGGDVLPAWCRQVMATSPSVYPPQASSQPNRVR